MFVKKKEESTPILRAPYKKTTSPMRVFGHYCNEASFTLVEILIVIGVIAILTAVTLVILNPVEYLKRGRDDQRMGDINSLQTLITQKEYSGNRISFGQSNVVYISLADSSSTCGSYTLPVLAAGWSYHCAPTTSYRNVDGTGWLPVDVSTSKTFAVLPLDPINDQNYYYAFIANSDNSFVLTSMFESQQELKNIAAKDNGTDDARYETGTNLALWTQASGLVGYWKFDEGSGTTTADSSGNGNTGTLINSPTWQTGSNCKEGSCISFNGTNQYINIGSLGAFPSKGTISFWMNASQIASYRNPLTTNYNGGNAGIRFEENSSGNFVVVVGNDGGTYGAGTYITSGMQASTWYHVVYTWDETANTSSGFLNGVQVFSQANTLWPTQIPDVAIGSGFTTDPARQWNGLIDDVQFYNSALTATEIQNLYTVEK